MKAKNPSDKRLWKCQVEYLKTPHIYHIVEASMPFRFSKEAIKAVRFFTV